MSIEIKGGGRERREGGVGFDWVLLGNGQKPSEVIRLARNGPRMGRLFENYHR